jgi:DNA-binding FadR family transcriptional regulator
MYKTVTKMTVTEQIMEQLAELITSGKIQPGEKLPNERDLAVRLGVTRGRIREALRALSLIGLITIKAGEGSFVNKREVPIPPETIVWMFHNERNNLDEIYAARKLIEKEIYLEALKHMNGEHKKQLKLELDKVLTFQPNQKMQNKNELFQNLLDGIDLFIGEHCCNRIYTKLMQTIVYLRRETSLRILNVPGAIESSKLTRKEIINAFLKNDEQALKSVLDQFFDRAKHFYENIISE